MMMSNTFPALLQTFFTERLLQQRRASPNTVASYRDSFRLLLRFAKENLDKEPSVLSFDDFTPDFLSAFLDYIKKDRGNSVRTRNNRLAAIHSFFRSRVSRKSRGLDKPKLLLSASSNILSPRPAVAAIK